MTFIVVLYLGRNAALHEARALQTAQNVHGAPGGIKIHNVYRFSG